MLATYKTILQDTHTEGLLDSLASAILSSCGCLTTFSVHIGASRYYMEDESADGIKERTTNEQWKVIGKIMTLVTRVVSSLAVLQEITLSL